MVTLTSQDISLFSHAFFVFSPMNMWARSGFVSSFPTFSPGTDED